ncbi:MAG TPA: hypothetical protein VKF40_09875 [Burkholderiales bacterium]|nr:hypothetical protein [Burkholderiales bacterium]
MLCILALAAGSGAGPAAEPESARPAASPSRLEPYISCDGFADGIRATAVDRRPDGAEPWRELSFGGARHRISVVEGYRVMYSYPRTHSFAYLNANRSDPTAYRDDRGIVSRQMAEMARADGNTELTRFSIRGFPGETLTKKELGGTTLGMTQIYADEDRVIVTVYFLNQVPAQRKFQTYQEFLSLRDRFVRGYIECVAARRVRPPSAP